MPADGCKQVLLIAVLAVKFVVMRPETLKVTISFQCLLNQVIGFLKLAAPTYSLTGITGNAVTLTLVTDCDLSPYIFEGGPAVTLDASREFAAEQATRFLRAEYGLQIHDLSSEAKYRLDLCAFLYEMKRIAIDSLNKPKPPEKNRWPVPPVRPHGDKYICIDYIDVLRVVVVATKARVSVIEVAELATTKWVAWLTVYPPGSIDMECIYSQVMSSCKAAKQDAAKRAIQFLRICYNVDIIDLNHGKGVYSGIKCALSRESYMSIPTPALPPAAPRKPKASSSFGEHAVQRSVPVLDDAFKDGRNSMRQRSSKRSRAISALLEPDKNSEVAGGGARQAGLLTESFGTSGDYVRQRSTKRSRAFGPLQAADKISHAKQSQVLSKQNKREPSKAHKPKHPQKDSDYYLSFGGSTAITSLTPNTGPVLPKYTPIAEVPATSSPDDRFDILGVVVYLEDTKKKKSSGGYEFDVRDVIVVDDSVQKIGDGLVISLYGDLATKDCAQLSAWCESFMIVSFRHLQPTSHAGLVLSYCCPYVPQTISLSLLILSALGFSLSSSMSTTIDRNPTGPEVNALRAWVLENQDRVTDHMGHHLSQRDGSSSNVIMAVKDVTKKTSGTATAYERHWIKVTIPDVKQEDVNAYIGCSGCRKRCDNVDTVKFYCDVCSAQCTAKKSIRLTAYGKQCEAFLGLKMQNLYRKRLEITMTEWPEFKDIAAGLKEKPLKLEVGPTGAIKRVGYLKWIVKSVELE
uniref:Uncharacterized protein n=1 Tax=Chenopodium quinoa TaxID=63459 RepID=A0A803LWN6_CHEQI